LAQGYMHPTEVQFKCLPQALLGKNIICQGSNRSGKTTLAVISTLSQLKPVDGAVSFLVLSPTREKASKIKEEYERLSKNLTSVKIGLFCGDV
ncbi:hypothetical protein PMAYCL1PPCAC_03275, partial [Pristionchus mayeri]